MGTFEQIRHRSYEVLGKIQERLRSDWTHDEHGPSHEQIQALEEARKHVAAAKAALVRAAGTPRPQQAAPAPPAHRSGMRRR